MFDKILEIFDGENDQSSIFGLLRCVRFDYDSQQPVRAFQKYIGISYGVQDAKGNPGALGQFFLTNLRIMWQMKSDPNINLTFGLDSIVSTDIKSIPVHFDSGFKHILTLKVQNPSQTRYQFKFSGFHQEDLRLFEKIADIHKKVLATKQFRATNLSLKFQDNYQPMDGEELQTSYDNVTFIENEFRTTCKLFLTDARLVIIKEGQKKMNYGIAWIMIRQVQYSAQSDIFKGVRLYFRGLMAPRVIFLYCIKASQTKKLQYELKSYCQTYNKVPNLGFSYQQQKIKEKQKQSNEIEEFEATKVNIGRRKNIYATSGDAGNIVNTEYNKQIGLMMERLPEGVQRADLWEILK